MNDAVNESGRISSTRRRLLLAGAGGALALGVGTFTWNGYTHGRAAWVERTIRSSLPGIDIDAPSLAVFVKDVLASDVLRSRLRRLGIFAANSFPWITARVPKIREGLDAAERHVLTEYLMGSNFFRVPDPRREPIKYSGPVVACGNPFTWMT